MIARHVYSSEEEIKRVKLCQKPKKETREKPRISRNSQKIMQKKQYRPVYLRTKEILEKKQELRADIQLEMAIEKKRKRYEEDLRWVKINRNQIPMNDKTPAKNRRSY